MNQIQILSVWRGWPRLAVITAPTTGSFSCGDGHGEQENKHGGCHSAVSAQLVQTKENGFFNQSLTELISTEEEKPIYNQSFFLKYPWQTITEDIISSQQGWGCRGPAETLDSPQANVTVVKWTRLFWNTRQHLESLLSILCPPSPIPSLFCLLQWQRESPFSCICTKSSNMRLPNSLLTNTTESNNWRINSSKTSRSLLF